MSELFHPGGPVRYEQVHKGACPRCHGDVHAVEVAGLLAYWKCSGCEACFGSREVPDAPPDGQPLSEEPKA